MKLKDRLELVRLYLRSVKGQTGGNQAIEWIMVVFLAVLLGGTAYYVSNKFSTAINDNNTTAFIYKLLQIFDVIPDWLTILVIVGFGSAIALVALAVYGVMKKKTESM